MKFNMDRERLAENSLRRKAAKHKGRNHWANWERRMMKQATQKSHKIAAAISLAKRRKFLAQARQYWRGSGDHPKTGDHP